MSGVWVLPVMVVVTGAVAAGFGLCEWYRYAAMVDTPTTRCAAAAIGRNELSGQVEPAQPTIAPVSGVSCAWYRMALIDKSSRHAQVMEEQVSSDPFWLVDDSGRVLVRPAGAEIDAPVAYEQPVSGRRLVREWRIEPGHEVYVLGEAGLRADAVALELADRGRAGRLLISTRSEPQLRRAQLARSLLGLVFGLVAAASVPAMLRLLTLDHDLRRLKDEIMPIGLGDTRDRPEYALFMAAFMGLAVFGYARNLRGRRASLLDLVVPFALAVALPLGFAITGVAHRRRDLDEASALFDQSPLRHGPTFWPAARNGMVLAAALYLVGLAAVYVVRLHNRLVAANQRAEAAASLVDVELRRRHDLVPELVKVVRAYVDHEQQALAAVSSTQALHQLAEAHPDLAADAVFRDLADRLRSIDDRVAYARQFHIDAVNVARDRRRTFPGLLVAPLVPQAAN